MSDIRDNRIRRTVFLVPVVRVNKNSLIRDIGFERQIRLVRKCPLYPKFIVGSAVSEARTSQQSMGQAGEETGDLPRLGRTTDFRRF